MSLKMVISLRYNIFLSLVPGNTYFTSNNVFLVRVISIILMSFGVLVKHGIISSKVCKILIDRLIFPIIDMDCDISNQSEYRIHFREEMISNKEYIKMKMRIIFYGNY